MTKKQRANLIIEELEKEYEIVTGMMMREKKMMKYIGGFPCKYIYILTKIIGCRNTSNLLNLIKGER